MEQDIRWRQRLENFNNAFQLLKDVQQLDFSNLSQLEKEGIVQRFEFTLELAWKTLKDKMENDGLILDQISPKSVIREAFANKYIEHADKWFQMISDRNLLSHTYDLSVFQKVVPIILNEYVFIFEELINKLK
ncbi:MAG: nucleotidyltransferase substrate binding protein [Flavobacteriia bacterium]|nr:nucleotidyltransferase substrate binding protein [Flavobacteriia bacterium]